MQTPHNSPGAYERPVGKLWLTLIGFLIFITGLFSMLFAFIASVLVSISITNVAWFCFGSLFLYIGRRALRVCYKRNSLHEF